MKGGVAGVRLILRLISVCFGIIFLVGAVVLLLTYGLGATLHSFWILFVWGWNSLHVSP